MMASSTALKKLTIADQDDPQGFGGPTRGDAEAAADKGQQTRREREPRSGLWFWAVE